MTAEVLLEHFHRLGDVPDAVPRLRRFILDLAVRGKLVDQDPMDESATALLTKIAKEKAAYPTGRKKGFSAKPLADDEKRFVLPSTWTWARTNDVTVYVQRGKSPKYSLEKKIPVIAQKCVQWVGFQLEKAQFIEPSSLAAYGEERYVQDGDLLWNSTGHGSLGRLIVFKERYKGNYPIIVADSHVTVIRPSKLINPDYLFCWFAGPLVQDEINDKSTGTTNQTELPVGTVMAYDVPVPPLAEQHRIVAKVDELMALCDRLEAAQQQREQERTRLTAASWQALVQDGGTEAARFALEQLPALTSRPAQVKALRQTILDLAVRGKLVEQDPRDEPAEMLLKRIAKEKESEGTKSKRQKAKAQNRTDVEGPFELPKGWIWASFPELGKFGRGKSKHRPRNDRALYVDGTYPLVQTGDVARSKGVVTTYTNLYNDVGLAQSAMWPKGTMCITVAANIADSGILSFDACFPDSVVGFVPATCFSNARYFEYFLRTAQADLLEFAPATAQKNINLEILEAVRIPLPPLAEQGRIVAKVDALMGLCDALEAALVRGEAVKGMLLEAVLAAIEETVVLKANAPTPQLAIAADAPARYSRSSAPKVLSMVDRAALNAWITAVSKNDPTLGRTKAEKIEHLIESHIGFDHGRNPVRDAAGPVDWASRKDYLEPAMALKGKRNQ